MPGIGSSGRGAWGVIAASLLLCCWVAGCGNAVAGTGAVDKTARTTKTGVIQLGLPATFGPLQRPAVAFDHERHALEASKDKGCRTCHEAGKNEALVWKFGRTTDGTDREALMGVYHSKCLDCHRSKAATTDKRPPLACGECHVKQGAKAEGWTPIAFDASLHARHVKALKKGDEEPCKTCHMAPNEKTGKLEYVKGKEATCRTCHGPADKERRPSLQHAAHMQCVGCHEKRTAQKLKAGPTTCKGCHDAGMRASIKRLDPIPRLVVKQKDRSVMQTKGSESAAVVFNHKAHESKAGFCTACHHLTQEKCETCHTIKGDEKGGGVRLVEASHNASSEFSCVGCHRIQTAKKDCAGCHRTMPMPPTQNSCLKCHSGPPGPPPPEGGVAETKLAPLPAVSKDFPEKVKIESIAKKYQPTEFPHLKITTRLDQIIRKSSLAGVFHGDVKTMCAGCHHHTPLGKRPPPCRDCHGPEAARTRDVPGLRAAYHRQCLGCHQEMGIKKTGCSDCHALAPKEVTQ